VGWGYWRRCCAAKTTDVLFRPPRRRGVTPGGKSRFPGFDVLDQVEHWDEVTAGVVLARLHLGTSCSFFSDEEYPTADALFDQLLGQFDEPKVPVLVLVDRRLALGQTDGWHYEDLPEDASAWRLTLHALDDEARASFNARFHELSREQQGNVLQDIHDANRWRGLPAQHVWSLWTRYAATAFYSHPWAWNEIGFGGPSYPRGYGALGNGQLEYWEVADHENADPVAFGSRIERAKQSHTAHGSSST
jgi:hypothetical protein